MVTDKGDRASAGQDFTDLAAIGAGVGGVPFESHTAFQQEVIEAVRLRDLGV